MVNILKYLFLYFIFIFSPFLSFSASVAIVSDSSFKAGNDVVAGFRDVLDKKQQNIDFTNIEPSAANKTDFDSFDLIFVIASDAVKDIVDKTQKPVVFALINDPVGRGIVDSMDPSGGNVTGVSLDFSPRDIALIMKSVIPGAANVGVFYSAKMSKMIDGAHDAFSDNGLVLKAMRVDDFSKIPPLVAQMKDSIDIFWCIPDNRLYTSESIAYVLRSFTDNALPVCGFSANITKAGALFSYSCDFKDIGKQAGEMGARILDGESAGSIAIDSPRKVKCTFNRKIKDFLKISIPEKVLALADEVF